MRGSIKQNFHQEKEESMCEFHQTNSILKKRQSAWCIISPSWLSLNYINAQSLTQIVVDQMERCKLALQSYTSHSQER